MKTNQLPRRTFRNVFGDVMKVYCKCNKPELYKGSSSVFTLEGPTDYVYITSPVYIEAWDKNNIRSIITPCSRDAYLAKVKCPKCDRFFITDKILNLVEEVKDEI